MEYIKKCEVCGIEYKTTGTTSKYCSYECKMKNHYAKEREKNKLNPRNCIICGTEFNPETKFSVCCCKECKDIRQKQLTKEKDDRNREKKFEGKIEGIDYVVCAICGQKCTQISSGHFKMHGITSKEYLTKYPNSKLSCDSFCVKYKGENNPNSVKNTTEDQRKERSPFSNAFYKKRNIDISEKDKLIKDIHSDMLYNTQIEFYLNKGMSNEEAENALNERQKTFSLEKCIEKYGEKDGHIIWKERQEKWRNTINIKYDGLISTGVSEVSQIFIDEILKACDKSILLYGINEKYMKNADTLKAYRYDLTNTQNRHIIEFNGDYWHCNPNRYAPDYFCKRKEMYAKDIWEFDSIKIKTAEDNGYKVMVIWESDFYKNPEDTMARAKSFILENNI